MIIEYNSDDHDDPGDQSAEGGGSTEEEKPTNKGTLILDATCAPQNISYPQDINLLNDSREHLEEMIDTICYEYDLNKPRTYRRTARKDYLSFAKCRKRSKKKIRKAIKQQLQYVRRDLGYIDQYLKEQREISERHAAFLETIRKVYEQQKYMYDNDTHQVDNRIVSISQPFIRPIVRGKAKSPTEFGAKLDLSIDNGIARIERSSFEPYNESDVLIEAVERYHERHGCYPERMLADKIYRNRENIRYCKERGIRLSGPALGRPKKDPDTDKKIEYMDAVDRIEVERSFSLAKRSFGLGLIMTKLEETTKSSIALSIVMSLRQFINLLTTL